MPKSQLYQIYLGNIYLQKQALERIHYLLNVQLPAFIYPSIKAPPDNTLLEFSNALRKYFNALEALYDDIITVPISDRGQYDVEFTRFQEGINFINSMIDIKIAELKQSTQYEKLFEILSEFYMSPLYSNNGLCNGLSAWWGYKMAERMEAHFYSVIDEICGTLRDDFSIDTSMFDERKLAFEKYNSHIRWLHNLKCIPNVESTQASLDVILEVKPEIFINGGLGSITNITMLNHKKVVRRLFELFPSDCIIHVTQCNHTIGAFKRDGQYYLYDSNDENGRPVISSDVDTLVAAMDKCLRNLSSYGASLDIKLFSLPHQMISRNEDDLLEIIHIIHKYRKAQLFLNDVDLIHTAVCTVSNITFDMLKKITNLNDAELISKYLAEKNILSYAYEFAGNISFINSILSLNREGIIQIDTQVKNDLLKNAVLDHSAPISASVHERMNPPATKWLTEQLLNSGAQFTCLGDDYDLPIWINDIRMTLLATMFDKCQLEEHGNFDFDKHGFIEMLTSKEARSYKYLQQTLEHVQKAIDSPRQDMNDAAIKAKGLIIYLVNNHPIVRENVQKIIDIENTNTMTLFKTPSSVYLLANDILKAENPKTLRLG